MRTLQKGIRFRDSKRVKIYLWVQSTCLKNTTNKISPIPRRITSLLKTLFPIIVLLPVSEETP